MFVGRQFSSCSITCFLTRVRIYFHKMRPRLPLGGFCNVKLPEFKLGVTPRVGLLNKLPLALKDPPRVVLLLELPSKEKLRVKPVGLLRENDDVEPAGKQDGFVSVVPPMVAVLFCSVLNAAAIILAPCATGKGDGPFVTFMAARIIFFLRGAKGSDASLNTTRR